MEDLITPCKCAGTMGHVHSTCLEKWLSRTARTFCELCNHNFRTVIEKSSFKEVSIQCNLYVYLKAYFLQSPSEHFQYKAEKFKSQ